MNVTSVYNYCPSIATYSFSLTCAGSSDCQALTSFPDVTCIMTRTTTSCSNGVVCSGAESNYTSISSLAQDPSGDLIEYNELFLSDYCEKSWFSVNGSNIGPLYTSNSCSNGTAGTNTTTLADIPTGASNSISNVSGADRRFDIQELTGKFLWLATAVLAPPQLLPLVAASPELYSTALDRRGLFGSFLPDLIDWVCGETSLSDIISDVFDNFESIACQLAVSYLETEVEQLATPKLWQACVGQVVSTVNNAVGSKIDLATNSTSVEHRLINDVYVWLLNLEQTQACNYAYSKILQIPDLATELCPEIETSVLGKPSSCGSLAGGDSSGGSTTTVSAPRTPSTCPLDDTCDGVCTDLQRDPFNCGACGKFCDEGICSDGVCECFEGWTNCDGTCTDLSVDVQNCGQCGTTCILSCTSDTCVECSSVFGPGWVSCPDQSGLDICTNSSDDIANCGKCGNACGILETCSNSICVSDVD